jgi:hypothetical protein
MNIFVAALLRAVCEMINSNLGIVVFFFRILSITQWIGMQTTSSVLIDFISIIQS